MISVEELWRRMKQYEGIEFTQMRGKQFTYLVKGDEIIPSTTDWAIPKEHFKKALERLPLKNMAPLQRDLIGPSYIFAIMNDERIRESNW